MMMKGVFRCVIAYHQVGVRQALALLRRHARDAFCRILDDVAKDEVNVAEAQPTLDIFAVLVRVDRVQEEFLVVNEGDFLLL